MNSRHLLRAGAHLLHDGERVGQGNPAPHELLRDRQQRRHRCLVAPVAQRDEHAELLHLAQHTVRFAHLEAARQLVARDDLRRLALERLGDRLHGREQTVGAVRRLLDHALDRRQVEALGLQLADQLEARQMLGSVVADALVDDRRLQQVARPVRADVAHGEAAFCGERLDRQRMARGRAWHHVV
jgi:hypothetical protein